MVARGRSGLGLVKVNDHKTIFRQPNFASFGFFTLDNAGVTRFDMWEDYFDHIVRALGIGVPVLPIDGNVGLLWGYARDNSVYWRTSSSNPWTPTTFIADQSNWDGVKVSIDLTADTFAIDYFDISANTWSNMVPAGTALGMPMTNLTNLGWQLEDGLFAGVGGKNFFDDFSITAVPEPGTWALLTLGTIAAGAYFRRRKLA